MRPDTAKRLAEQALQLLTDLNKMARETEAAEQDEDSLHARHAIGRVAWAVYYEILRPTLEEHPSVEHKLGPEAGTATKHGLGPRVTRSAAGAVRSSAPRSRRPRRTRVR